MSSQWQSPWNAAERKATKKMLLSMLRTALWLQNLSMHICDRSSYHVKIGKASISRVATALAIPLSCLVTCQNQEVADCADLSCSGQSSPGKNEATAAGPLEQVLKQVTAFRLPLHIRAGRMPQGCTVYENLRALLAEVYMLSSSWVLPLQRLHSASLKLQRRANTD